MGARKDTYFDEVELNKGLDKKYFGKALKAFVLYAGVLNPATKQLKGYKAEDLLTQDSKLMIIGSCMERTNEELKQVNDELLKSKEMFENLSNDIKRLHDSVEKQLSDFLKEMIESRMAVMRETRDILGQLKDVRKFFLEEDYTKEIDRLQKFTDLCKELKKLKENGTLDAVSETIIKLSIKEN